MSRTNKTSHATRGTLATITAVGTGALTHHFTQNIELGPLQNDAAHHAAETAAKTLWINYAVEAPKPNTDQPRPAQTTYQALTKTARTASAYQTQTQYNTETNPTLQTQKTHIQPIQTAIQTQKERLEDRVGGEITPRSIEKLSFQEQKAYSEDVREAIYNATTKQQIVAQQRVNADNVYEGGAGLLAAALALGVVWKYFRE
jgi:hypothetical protein